MRNDETPPRLSQTIAQLLIQARDAGFAPSNIAALRSDYETGCRLFGGEIRSSGKPFACHLIGTASIAMYERAPYSVIRACLIHFAYNEGLFVDGRKGETPAHRAWLNDRTTPEVEDIVHDYSTFEFTPESVDRALADPGALSERQKHLLLMRVCNEVDETTDHECALSGKFRFEDPDWFERLIRLAQMLNANICAAHLRIAANDDHQWLKTDKTYSYAPHQRSLVRGAARKILKRV